MTFTGRLGIKLPILQAPMAGAQGVELAAAEARGLGDFSPRWAGQNTSRCRKIPATQVIAELAEGL